MMMKTTSASNLLDANTSPAIGAEIEDGCPQSLPPSTTEKRRHAEIGDGSPQSPTPPTEKRNCVESMEQPPETGEQERYVGEGFDKLPAYAQERYLKVKERFGPLWEKLRMYEHRASDKQIGDINFLFRQKHQGYGEKDYPNFRPILNIRENREFYDELRGLAEIAVAYFNDKNNKNLCFEDFERVASCGDHYLLTIKAIDPLDATSVMVLRSKVLKGKVDGGIVEAKVQLCELVTLDAY